MEPRLSDTSAAVPPIAPKRTQLYRLHLANAARMVPFAGYEMPVQYSAGVLKEHLHARVAAGLFDISHMGQIVVRPKSGIVADAAIALERVVPVDALGLAPGRQRYAFFTNGNGGILDDLMIAHRGDHFLLIVNAACKDGDEAHLRANLSNSCAIERLDRALIALQGPLAERALARIVPGISDMRFMDVRAIKILGADCVAMRSGYTGEDGFEISVPSASVETIASALLEDECVALIGLGARDSLRLEAGLCLYGADITDTTTPVEANLSWAIQPSRRRGGSREAGFPGAAIILRQLTEGAPRSRIGFLPTGRAPVRAGAEIFESENAGDAIGRITSGGFGPTLDRPVAMGYVNTSLAKIGTIVFAEVRNQRLPMTVAPLPFVQTKFKRA
jgi:aminomethyltransferase